MKPQEDSSNLIKQGLPVRQEQLIQSGYMSRSTLHRLKKKGLPTHKVGGCVYIDIQELRDFLLNHNPEQQEAPLGK